MHPRHSTSLGSLMVCLALTLGACRSGSPTSPSTTPGDPIVNRPGQEIPVVPPDSMVWTDEFDGSTVDLTSWNVENSSSQSFGGALQAWRPANVVVSEGQLHLVSTRESNGNRAYTSGAVTTRNKFTFGGKDFKVEVRARLPRGRGIWPAIWTREGTMPNPDTGVELDIMEMLGHEPFRVYMTQHVWGGGTHLRRPAACEATDTDYSTGFHVYAIEQAGGRLKWSIDGSEKCSSNADLPVLPSYLLINTSIGGEWPGAPDGSTPFPQSFDIDYVRITTRVN